MRRRGSAASVLPIALAGCMLLADVSRLTTHMLLIGSSLSHSLLLCYLHCSTALSGTSMIAQLCPDDWTTCIKFYVVPLPFLGDSCSVLLL